MSPAPVTIPPGPKHFTDSRTTNFYYSFFFLPAEKRRAIEAVYAFARGGDDAADNQLEPAAAAREIGRYRNLLEACYSQQPAQLESAALQTLAEAVRRFHIPRQPFDDLLAGLEMDLATDHQPAPYRTFAELEVYCYRVASTIGLIAIEIFGYRNPRTREYAVALGKALQMVNILRDVHSDARKGRVYLPQEDLERFNVRPPLLGAGCYGPEFVSLMGFEADRARKFFREARRLLPPEDRASMKAAEIMAAIYWRLLRKIERRSYNVFGEPIRLSRPLKLWTALAVYLGVNWQGSG
ncbi:MAG: phytoene/squalene synthase family protein [Terriglobia bacterium]